MSYTKLFHRIVTSSIWDEPNETRIVWITMLAMANIDGYVGSTVKSLAMLSRVSEDDCKKALVVLLSPDPHSRSAENEGRRIETVEGGWRLLNYDRHRNALSDDPNAIKTRERVQRYRALRNVTSRYPASASDSVSSSESVPKENPRNQNGEPKGMDTLSIAYAKGMDTLSTQLVNTCGKYSQMVAAILQCRPEFSRIRPEDVATELRLAEGLGLEEAEFKKRMDEFMRDAANCLDPAGVKVPLRMLRAYMQGKPATGSGQRGYKTCTDLGTGGL